MHHLSLLQLLLLLLLLLLLCEVVLAVALLATWCSRRYFVDRLRMQVCVFVSCICASVCLCVVKTIKRHFSRRFRRCTHLTQAIFGVGQEIPPLKENDN